MAASFYAKANPWVQDTDEVAHCDFSCSSVVGMLLYLFRYSLPDISYTVNCTTIYMFHPRHSYELAFVTEASVFKETHSQSIM